MSNAVPTQTSRLHREFAWPTSLVLLPQNSAYLVFLHGSQKKKFHVADDKTGALHTDGAAALQWLPGFLLTAVLQLLVPPRAV